ncbi:energy transducer TonB [Vibrio splendidus]|uniref:energy transducer TonB n=1 Tax=Vibrio splendidus TaxID=29497 RepID=UPI0002D652A6|nr:energy transducer TonB [Vibrio splendidus]OEF25010.1 energy transducer TonB [Vibrio splendidus 1S-124]PTP86359.1 energy transducer TonB [Vibrio splendidus]PTQ17544.1 energy transducer TonB [Vibrio splendidus]
MSLLADPNYRMIEPRNRFLFFGLSGSIILHILFVVAYMWTPEYNFTPPVQAAPIMVSIVGPLAASKQKSEDTDLGEPQQEIIQQTVQEMITPDPSYAPKAPTPQLVKGKKTSPFLAPEKPKKDRQKIQEKPVKAEIDKIKPIKPKPKPKRPEPKIVKDIAKEYPEQKLQTIMQKAQSKQNIAAQKTADAASALRKGQLSENGRMARVNWQQTLHAHLEKQKKYPRKAKRMKQRGTPVIRFTMDRKGHVLDVVLVKSSGTSSLDKEAIDLVYRAQPLTKPPSTIAGNKLSLTLPINFTF